ncbi:MAG TPA: menaquinone biosynthesis protein [Candidatus Acidoferrum sp.]|nr:menaquinone biosynthesis protein [Candidatus Acidoferrum sp.]
MVQKLRISIVQYLNTAPLVWGFTRGELRGKYELSFTVPSQCAEALRSGAADIAIIPAIEYQRISGLAVLPDLAIASRNRVRSLLILSKKPIEQVRSIALDRSSRSTQALTRILAKQYWKIAAEFCEAAPDLRAMLERADAAMLIGDPALRMSLAMEKGSTVNRQGRAVCQGAALGVTSAEILHVYDVVGEWRAMTGLPAVMAIWAAKRELANDEVTGDFLASRDFGMSQLAAISLEASRELELPAAALEAYLRESIDFSLGEENRRGLERYFQEAAKLDLIPHARAIEWASGSGLVSPEKTAAAHAES